MANGHRPHEGDERGPPLRDAPGALPRDVPDEARALVQSGELRRAVFSNLVRKAGYGLGAGLVLGLLVFRQRKAAICLATGAGLGVGFTEGVHMLRTRDPTGRCCGTMAGVSCPVTRPPTGVTPSPPAPPVSGGNGRPPAQ